MIRTGVILDERWELVTPVLPVHAGRRGRPWRDPRQMLEAMAWRFRIGSPWRDVPTEFGPWQTLWKRQRRRSPDRTDQRIVAQAVRHNDAPSKPDWLRSVASTIVRAQQHAAGALCTRVGRMTRCPNPTRTAKAVLGAG
jgi:putative transposase